MQTAMALPVTSCSASWTRQLDYFRTKRSHVPRQGRCSHHDIKTAAQKAPANKADPQCVANAFSCSPSLNTYTECITRRNLLSLFPLAAALALPQHALCKEATEQVQQAYDQYAPSYDNLDDGSLSDFLGFPQLRSQLLAKAEGAVLEVAVGTGLNLPLYNWQQVSSLTAIDISKGMLQEAQRRAASLGPARPLTFQQANVEALPLASASFDCVVDTFSLCVFPNPVASLKEMARVVKPGGRVLLLEHSKSDNALLGAYQDLTATAVAATAKGCVWNQDIPRLLTVAGLQPVSLQRFTAGTITMVEAVRAA